MEESKLSVSISNTQPIELMDFTKAFCALGDEYCNYIRMNAQSSLVGDAKLYIKEIRRGSVVADLIAVAKGSLFVIESAMTVKGFFDHLNDGFDYLLGKVEEKRELSKQSLKNLSQIVSPVANDNGSKIKITLVNNGTFNFSLNSLDSNAIQNKCEKLIDSLDAKVSVPGFHSKVLLYWFQARNDAKSKTGDKAIVESISPSPVKAVFMNEQLKASMLLDGDENPFTSAFLVDIAVETIDGVPKVYKIVEFYERVPM